MSRQTIVFASETSELLTVSQTLRDPSERPDPKALLKGRAFPWISDTRTVYVRTGNVATIGERP